MALKFVKDNSAFGVGIGGGAAVLGLVGGSAIVSRLPASVAAPLMKYPWAPAAALSALAAGALWFTKKKTAAKYSAVSSAITLAPFVYQSFMMPAAALPSAPADGAASGFGVAVAESRGFGAPPSVDVFSDAPSNISLLGNANNADQSLLPAANNPSVFGGGVY